MSPKHQRLVFVLCGMAFLFTAAGLVLSNFNDNLVFFYSPSDLQSKPAAPGQKLRIGGLVEAGSLKQNGTIVTFSVTDLKHSVPVTYQGLLPALFREGQGTVAEGSFDDSGLFRATSILAKHDENYMPPEVAKALKDSGQWKGQ